MNRQPIKFFTLDDIKLSNKNFWTCFAASSFPTAMDEKTDLSLVEIIEENELADIKWWNNFTGYYDEAFDEADGCIDEPMTLVCRLSSEHILKVEFHPGDIIYYANDKQIACTGPDYKIHVFPFSDLLNYTDSVMDRPLFLLLLPLAVIEKQEANQAVKVIADVLAEIFCEPFCGQLADSIVYGLMEE